MKTLFTSLALLLIIVTQSLTAQTWTQQTSNYQYPLLNLTFVNQDLGYVSGYNGTILKTTNGGANWATLNTGTSHSLPVVQFIDQNIGYASGGFVGGTQMNTTLIKTVNGGTTWLSTTVAPTKCGSGMWFLSSDTGFYAYADTLYGNSTIVKTTDGGLSWNQVYSGLGWVSYFYFTDSKNGYATVGFMDSHNGTILKTTDGGQNWTTIDMGIKAFFSGIYFFNKDTGFVGGHVNSPIQNNHSIYKTVNGGATWQAINSGNMIFKISFGDRNNGYVLNVDTTGKGTVLKTTDGGNTWVDEITPKGNLRGICFLSKDLGYAVGDSGVILKYGFATSVNDMLSETENNNFLYPNPATDIVNLNIDNTNNADLTLNIYNVIGDLVYTQLPRKNQQQISVSNLSNGIYIVEITSKEGSRKQKMIVQK